MLASGVSVVGGDHRFDIPGTPAALSGRPEQRHTTVGRDVWIGRQAIILQGVEIGDGAIIAAGAVVAGDVPPNTIVAGIPARRVRLRFEDSTDWERHAEAISR